MASGTPRSGVDAAARATVRVLAASNPDGSARANGETLFIDVSVNGRPLAGIIRAERLADGRRRTAPPVSLAEG